MIGFASQGYPKAIQMIKTNSVGIACENPNNKTLVLKCKYISRNLKSTTKNQRLRCGMGIEKIIARQARYQVAVAACVLCALRQSCDSCPTTPPGRAVLACMGRVVRCACIAAGPKA